MKAVILAGGLGTRLAEETELKPKPLVEIGGFPIIWHIMKIYSAHGINDFIVCCGYKGYLIKEYFSNYALHMSDVTFDMPTGTSVIHRNNAEPWKVALIDTGLETQTGGRLRRVRGFLDVDEDFCFTYGDGVADINISELIKFHKAHGKLATLTAVRPPGRYGALKIDSDDRVTSFKEKPEGDESWINGGFFVLKPAAIDYISNDLSSWEGDPLNELSVSGELYSFHHYGFWQAMDTLREKNYLNTLWEGESPPWKIWQ